ncbi:MAG: sigma-70 family RNA polymerase sigma factor [candidate division Zixibacteria bacterium]|nr:sigma-70 family RNA polymerase sigma factor [candidate division Zixibacteria bacterium]
MYEAEDIALVEQCLQGDRGAFETLVDRYQQPVFNIALRMVRRHEDAEDIAQTVFLKAYQNLDRFDAKYKFFSWIYRMTINESINFLDRQKSLEQFREASAPEQPSADRTMEKADTNRALKSALGRLSPDNRAVIVLRHFEDLSYEEIAQTLKIPEKTVKSRLFTARRLLAEALTQAKGVSRD